MAPLDVLKWMRVTTSHFLEIRYTMQADLAAANDIKLCTLALTVTTLRSDGTGLLIIILAAGFSFIPRPLLLPLDSTNMIC
jgi:hypothetical protein